MVPLEKITTHGKALYLAYDQGLEHGPTDFTHASLDPGQIIKIALYGEYNGVILQKGVAEKYYAGSPFGKELSRKIPLIVKLNGKTNLLQDHEPYSPQLCTVDEALHLGASAVGYTIYVGSEHEAQMMEDFARVVEAAHGKGIPVLAWMYPRGKAVVDRDKRELTAYAARIGLEIGADIVKLQYPGSKEGVTEAVEAAGKTLVVLSGGEKQEEEEFLSFAQTIVDAGAAGMAVGRNIWQHKDPLSLTKQLKTIIFT